MADNETVLNDEEPVGEDDIIMRRRKTPAPRTDISPASVADAVKRALETVRAKRPAVACLSNAASSAFTADALLALGAFPLLLEDAGEAAASTSFCGSLLVNVGRLSKTDAETMRACVARANVTGKPWVLDPETVGPLPLRTYLSRELIRRFPAIIVGRPPELLALAGVDMPAGTDALVESARLANVTHAAVAVKSDTLDRVCGEGAPRASVKRATTPSIAGAGCVQAALAAAFIAALGSRARYEAAVAASLVYAAAARIAAAKGPGAFKIAFVDALASLSAADVLVKDAFALEP